jgi:hypothetical protein
MMCSWFRRKRDTPAEAPVKCQENPGIATRCRVAIARGDNSSWTENINLVELAARVLNNRGSATTTHDSWLEHCDSGLVLLPMIVGHVPLDHGGIRTVTTIEVHHPQLQANGIFEFQHATGPSLEDSICQGFDQWAQTDLVVFLDALRDKPSTCMLWELEFPAKDRRPARKRRAVLGPVAHLMAKPPAAISRPAIHGDAEEHDFCPCCLLTRSFPAFKSLFEVDEFYGIRLYVMRDEHGVTQADCRVNGRDWPNGVPALCKYAEIWPQAGFEFRKQYVVIQSTT